MPAALTRREWLRLSAGALLSLGLWPGRLRGADAPATHDFTFIAVNDLHAFEDACRPWFDDVVRQMKASAPTAEFCLLGGDLAENGTPAQLTLIKDSFSALGIPCHAVVGNHDYQSATDRSAYERIFPEQINYSFTHRGWQIIGLDSSEGTKAKETRISATTLTWLDQNLSKLDLRRPTILFTHFPLGDSVWARPLNADDLLRALLRPEPSSRLLRPLSRVHRTYVPALDHHHRQMLRARPQKSRWFARERLVCLSGNER